MKIDNYKYTVMTQFRQIYAGFSPKRLSFNHRAFCVGFVTDKVKLEEVSSKYLVIPCHTPYSSIPTPEVCNRPDLTAHYCNLGPHFDFISELGLCWTQCHVVKILQLCL
jgi:hypothetical protein